MQKSVRTSRDFNTICIDFLITDLGHRSCVKYLILFKFVITSTTNILN